MEFGVAQEVVRQVEKGLRNASRLSAGSVSELNKVAVWKVSDTIMSETGNSY